jgi:hypothetical protein
VTEYEARVQAEGLMPYLRILWGGLVLDLVLHDQDKTGAILAVFLAERQNLAVILSDPERREGESKNLRLFLLFSGLTG